MDSWLISHATPTSSSVELSSPTHNQSRAGSGATTPVRKISAHEFERGGLLKPIISTIDGQPTFLTGPTEGQTSGGHSPTPGRRQRRSRHELKQLDEKELIFELVSNRFHFSKQHEVNKENARLHCMQNFRYYSLFDVTKLNIEDEATLTMNRWTLGRWKLTFVVPRLLLQSSIRCVRLCSIRFTFTFF